MVKKLLDDFDLFHDDLLNQIVQDKRDGFDFILNNTDYFSEHTFGDIPSFLLTRIEDLSKGMLYPYAFPATAQWKKIIDESEQFLNCIFTFPPFLLADSLVQKVDSNIPLSILFGENSDFSECNDLIEKLDLTKHQLQDKFQHRIHSQVLINLIISEKQAAILFPDKSGVTDIHSCFVSNDNNFVSWCNDFFKYKWMASQTFSRLRI